MTNNALVIMGGDFHVVTDDALENSQVHSEAKLSKNLQTLFTLWGI